MTMKSKKIKANNILHFINENQDIIVPLGNGEPHTLISTLEEEHKELKNVTIHQILALKEREYINGKYKGHLEHTSYF